MNKSVRINLLVITIVVTLFVFAGLWFTRPGVSDDILERARARQREPLMEITEPLRTTRVEEPVDTTELAREIRQSIEPELTESVRSSLMADDQFIAEVVSQVTKSRAFVDAVVPHYDYQAEIDELTARLQQSLTDQLKDLDTLDAALLIDQAITDQIPLVIDGVLNTLEANKDYIVAIARAELSDLISEDEIVDLYLANRAALVYDIVPMILADVEAIQRGEVVPSKVLAEEAATEKPVVEKPVVEAVVAEPEPPVVTVPEKPVVTVALEEVVTPALVEPVAPRVPPAPAQPTVSVVRMVVEEPVVVDIGIAVPVEEPLGIEVVVEEVVAEELAVEEPVVEELVAEEPVEPVVITDEVAYEAERQRLRNAEIEKYLRLIGEITD